MIRLRALGALDLRAADGQELRGVLAQRRRIALLAYLALAAPRGLHSRDTLLALFWPEYDSERARNALSQAVHFLRRSLGPDTIVSRNGDVVGLNWSQFWCDAVAFDELLEAGRTAEALDIYRGDLLEGFHTSDEDEFERWLDRERARYANQYAAALESVAEERERASDFGGAIAYWRRLTTRDPCNSRVALRLMRALVASGDPAAAVQHAEAHRGILREEMELAPDAELEAFLQRIRSGQAVRGHSEVVSPEAPSRSEVSARDVDRSEERRGHRKRMLVPIILFACASAAALTMAARNGRPTRPDQTYVRELYQRGRNAENSRNFRGIQTAKEAYRRAIERDSTFALGYAGLAGVYHFMADYAYAPVGPALDTARSMAQRAVQLDSTLPETRTALGVTLGDAAEFDAAEREFRRAIELDHGNARAHYWYSVLLVALGRADEALSESKLAAKLDSFAPRGIVAMQRYALHLQQLERPWLRPPYVEQPVLKLEPGEPWARANSAVSMSSTGRCPEARSEILAAQQLVSNDNFRMLPFVGTVYWNCGERERARAIVRGMKRRPDVTDHGYRVAILHTLFGEKDSALVWLQHERWTMTELSGLSGGALLDPLRSDPRFLQLLQRIGVRGRPQARRAAPDGQN